MTEAEKKIFEVRFVEQTKRIKRGIYNKDPRVLTISSSW